MVLNEQGVVGEGDVVEGLRLEAAQGLRDERVDREFLVGQRGGEEGGAFSANWASGTARRRASGPVTGESERIIIAPSTSRSTTYLSLYFCCMSYPFSERTPPASATMARAP